MKLITFLTFPLALVSALSPYPIAAHRFDDGFVERSMAIVVRNDIASVEYSIGLNDVTIQQLLNEWNPAQSADQAESIPVENPVENEAQSKSDKTKSEPTGQRNVDSAQDNGNANQTLNDSANSISAKSQSEKKKKDDAGPHSHDFALFAKFKKTAAQSITDRIQIQCDGKILKTKNVSIINAPRHPFSLTVSFEFVLPTDEGKPKTVQLNIVDRNFAKQSGAVRYAIKTRGKAMLLQSNVAPIIIRADRVDVEPVKNSETITQPCVEARLKTFPTSKS